MVNKVAETAHPARMATPIPDTPNANDRATAIAEVIGEISNIGNGSDERPQNNEPRINPVRN